eukprot:3760544-Rhodomonas_salina.2
MRGAWAQIVRLASFFVGEGVTKVCDPCANRHNRTKGGRKEGREEENGGCREGRGAVAGRS